VRAETTSEKPEVKTGPLQAFQDYIRDVRVEMSKVTWPTRDELRESTIVVLVMVAVMTVFIGIVDWILSRAFEGLIRVILG
jgi:preprotein translocase subunit SecE